VTATEQIFLSLRFAEHVTLLASGWFAGTASRGRYEALLHSGLLVGICYAVFTAGGLL